MQFLKSFLFSIGMMAILLPAFSQEVNSERRDAAYDKMINEREIIPYDHIREADVFWAKRVWRVIDCNEKMNKPFIYPQEPLIKILMDAIASEKVTVFEYEDFTVPKTSADVSNIGGSVDTIAKYDQYGNYVGDTVVVNEFNPDRVDKFRIKEDWFFDENTSTLQVRILGIAPLMKDEDADVYIPMFWAYYPDLRPVIVKHEVFNEHNSAVRLSWDDLFEMRFFASYVMKEDNVYDRRIADYATGIDALLESERVKQNIFTFEHDLWDY